MTGKPARKTPSKPKFTPSSKNLWLVCARADEARVYSWSARRLTLREALQAHAYGPFSEEIAGGLERMLKTGKLGRLILCAPPRFMEKLLGSIGPDLRDVLVDSCARDLVDASPKELEKYFRKSLGQGEG